MCAYLICLFMTLHMSLFPVRLKHAAIDRIEQELHSKRELQKKLAGMLIAMERAMAVYWNVNKLLHVSQVENV